MGGFCCKPSLIAILAEILRAGSSVATGTMKGVLDRPADLMLRLSEVISAGHEAIPKLERLRNSPNEDTTH